MKKFIGFACILLSAAMFFSCNDTEEKKPQSIETSAEYEENDFEVPQDGLDKDNYLNFKNPDEKTTEAVTENATEAVTTTAIDYENAPEPDYKKATYIDVPFMSQDDYPTGCELVSTSMVLSYYGYDLEPIKIIEDGYLKTVNVEYKDGKPYGGNPNEVFIGDPRNSGGYGCYSGAIVKALKKYFENESALAYTLDDKDLSEICENFIANGEPVIIWASIDMEPLEKSENYDWIIEKTGKEFTWLANEHCMVLVGYDDYYYYIHDPQKGEFTPYKRCDVEKRYDEMGRQAVAVTAW